MIYEDLEKICQHYGIRGQLKKLSEEVFELQEAVIEHEQELFIKANTDHVAEELADVMVLWEQIRLHYGIPSQTIQGIITEKVERQLKRIENENCIEVNTVKPATKEQRDTLFAKMEEAGYEWDADRKELKKIEQEPAWSDADEERFVSCLQRLGTGNIEQPDTINTMWIKSIKNRVQSIAKFVGEEQYMKGVRDGVNDVIKSPEDYGLLPSPFKKIEK